MKKAILTIVILLSSLVYSGSGFSSNRSKFGKNNVEIIFNRKSHFDQLVSFRDKVLKENGIVLTYKSLKFDEQGDLISIEIKVDCKDGFAGSAVTDHITNSSNFGFLQRLLFSEKTSVWNRKYQIV